MARMGMDVDLVEEKGRALKADAEKIAQLVRQIDALVRRLQGLWDGQDGRDFVNTWWPRHKQSLLLCSLPRRGRNYAWAAKLGIGNDTVTVFELAPPCPAAP